MSSLYRKEVVNDKIKYFKHSSFKHSITLVDFSGFLKCFNHNVFFFVSFNGHP